MRKLLYFLGKRRKRGIYVLNLKTKIIPKITGLVHNLMIIYLRVLTQTLKFTFGKGELS